MASILDFRDYNIELCFNFYILLHEEGKEFIATNFIYPCDTLTVLYFTSVCAKIYIICVTIQTGHYTTVFIISG